MANAIRGDNTAMGYENSDAGAPDPYGTALDLTSYAEAKICAQITPEFTASELEFDTVGCGGNSGFGTQAAIENREFRVTLSGDVGFSNGFDRLMAQFMGASSAPVEQNVGQGDYLHVLSFAPTANAHFGTLAWETSDDDVIEMKSTYTETINISMAGVGEPIRYTATLVSNDIEVDSGAAVNNNADLQSLTFNDSSLIVPKCEHFFAIKPMLDDGTDIALAPADIVPIISYELEMETPLEVINEMTGGACNSPTQSGSRSGTLTVTFKEHKENDELSYVDWLSGTYYQCLINWTGDTIGSGDPRGLTIRCPKMILIEAPDYQITDPGFNQYTLVFRLLDSENTIPGFTSNSVEVALTNERAGEYLLT